MKLNIRRLVKQDLDIAKKWWKAWPEWQPIPDDFLPETGVVVEKENKPVVIGFIYLTNAKVALLEWIISDPLYRDDDRNKAIKLLISGAENMIKHLDYKYAFSICKKRIYIYICKDTLLQTLIYVCICKHYVVYIYLYHMV